MSVETPEIPVNQDSVDELHNNIKTSLREVAEKGSDIEGGDIDSLLNNLGTFDEAFVNDRHETIDGSYKLMTVCEAPEEFFTLPERADEFQKGILECLNSALA